MKKLAITSFAVLVALIGFTAILVFLPCGDVCCGEKTEQHGSKCSGEKKDCKHEGKCDNKKSGCAHEGKCGKEKSGCAHEGKCGKEKSGCGSGNHENGKSGCDKGEGSHEGCGGGNEKCMVREWTDADGKVHKEVKMMIDGDGKGMSCPMENSNHSACCGCCPMRNGGGYHHGDSSGSDSVRIKVRGKL